MAQFTLTSKTYGTHVVLLDDDVLQVVGTDKWWLWQPPKSRHNGWSLYVVREIRGQAKRKVQYLHRVVYEHLHPNVDISSLHVDHINGNGLDNRGVNLRHASVSQNQCNRGKTRTNSHGFKGVIFDPRRGVYTARAQYQMKVSYGPARETAEAAHEDYKRIASELHGDFFNPGKIGD